MTDLHERLSALGDDLDWPPTPAFEVRVPQRRRAPIARRTLVLAALLTLLLVAGVAAAVVISLDGATIEQRDEPRPPEPEIGALALGRPIELADAPFTPLVPERAGPPESVHLRDGIEVALTYPPARGRPRSRTNGLGLLVTEFRGDLHPDYVGKIAFQGTVVERLRVDGERAVWIEGAPHFFFYRPPGGQLEERELRLAENVLLVERGPLLVRLEGAFERDEALALARSLRPA